MSRKNIRYPTMKYFESWLKRYWLGVTTSTFLALAALFRGWCIDLIARHPPDVLAETIVWLGIIVLSGPPTLIYYVLRFKCLEKDVLKRDPTFYRQREFDKAFDKFAKGSAQDGEP